MSTLRVPVIIICGRSEILFVRSKNTVNILIKNWLDVCIGALVYWATGYALMYGSKGNSFVSWSYFLGIGLPGTNEINRSTFTTSRPASHP